MLLFWSVGAYNRLVRLRAQATRTFAPLALQLGHYAALLKPLESAPQDPTWASMQGALSQLSACLTEAQLHPLDPACIRALATAEQVLQLAWHTASLPAEGTAPHALAARWAELDLQVQHARQAFAPSVQEYNAAIRQFPALLLAWLFGFRAAHPF